VEFGFEYSDRLLAKTVCPEKGFTLDIRACGSRGKDDPCARRSDNIDAFSGVAYGAKIVRSAF
jgi:hypothetical protein